MDQVEVGQLRVSSELGMCVITRVSKDGWVNAVWLTGTLASEGDGADEGPSASFTGHLWRVVVSATA